MEGIDLALYVDMSSVFLCKTATFHKPRTPARGCFKEQDIPYSSVTWRVCFPLLFLITIISFLRGSDTQTHKLVFIYSLELISSIVFLNDLMSMDFIFSSFKHQSLIIFLIPYIPFLRLDSNHRWSLGVTVGAVHPRWKFPRVTTFGSSTSNMRILWGFRERQTEGPPRAAPALATLVVWGRFGELELLRRQPNKHSFQAAPVLGTSLIRMQIHLINRSLKMLYTFLFLFMLTSNMASN